MLDLDSGKLNKLCQMANYSCNSIIDFIVWGSEGGGGGGGGIHACVEMLLPPTNLLG